MTTIDMHRARWLRRGDIALRILTAVPIGYAVASLWAMALARILPMARSEASLTGALVALALCAVVAMYAFAARSGLRAFAVVVALGALAGAITWISIGAGGRA